MLSEDHKVGVQDPGGFSGQCQRPRHTVTGKYHIMIVVYIYGNPLPKVNAHTMQVIDPTKRLGCDQQGGYDPLRKHVFFEAIDWKTIPEQTPPKLLPYLPSKSKGEVGLRSDVNVREEVNRCGVLTLLRGEITII